MIDGLPDAIFFNIVSTWFSLACSNHALSLHLCNFVLGGGNDTKIILHRSHARNPKSGLLSDWIRKQYG